MFTYIRCIDCLDGEVCSNLDCYMYIGVDIDLTCINLSFL